MPGPCGLHAGAGACKNRVLAMAIPAASVRIQQEKIQSLAFRISSMT